MKKLWPSPRMLLAIVTLAVPALAGCGGDDGGGGGGGGSLDGKVVSSLSADEKKQLCDYVGGLWGGYGKVKDCGGGLTVEGPKSQDECVSSHGGAGCSATVGALKPCLAALVQGACSDTLELPPACKNIPPACLK